MTDRAYAAVVASKPEIGDIVFTRIGGPIFSRVATTTQSWTSHVGIIVDFQQNDWIVAESGIPFVRKTPLRKFLGHSANQEYSIRRLRQEPTAAEKRAMLRIADLKMGTPYALGFDLKSKNTFCSSSSTTWSTRAPASRWARSRRLRPSSLPPQSRRPDWDSGVPGSWATFRGSASRSPPQASWESPLLEIRRGEPPRERPSSSRSSPPPGRSTPSATASSSPLA